MWEVVYKKSVRKDLKCLSQEVQYIIRRAIEEKLVVDPIRFGVPLRRDLKGLMKLRVGDYRVIYSIERKQVIIYIVKIGHRKEVYDR